MIRNIETISDPVRFQAALNEAATMDPEAVVHAVVSFVDRLRGQLNTILFLQRQSLRQRTDKEPKGRRLEKSFSFIVLSEISLAQTIYSLNLLPPRGESPCP